MFSVFFIVALVLLISAFLRGLTYSPGDAGEGAVAWRLRWLPRDQYFIINDLMIEKRNGYTAQIDHVVVSPYGIFVIETKNISGHVYGSEDSKTWTRYWKGYKRGGFYGEDNMSFYNPVLQNDAHIKALYEQLSNYHPKFVSIIAFSPQARLKVNVQRAVVIYWTYIRRVITHYNEQVMSIETAQEIYQYLLSINIEDKARRQEHVAQAEINKMIFMN